MVLGIVTLLIVELVKLPWSTTIRISQTLPIATILARSINCGWLYILECGIKFYIRETITSLFDQILVVVDLCCNVCVVCSGTLYTTYPRHTFVFVWLLFRKARGGCWVWLNWILSRIVWNWNPIPGSDNLVNQNRLTNSKPNSKQDMRGKQNKIFDQE